MLYSKLRKREQTVWLSRLQVTCALRCRGSTLSPQFPSLQLLHTPKPPRSTFLICSVIENSGSDNIPFLYLGSLWNWMNLQLDQTYNRNCSRGWDRNLWSSCLWSSCLSSSLVEIGSMVDALLKQVGFKGLSAPRAEGSLMEGNTLPSTRTVFR